MLTYASSHNECVQVLYQQNTFSVSDLHWFNVFADTIPTKHFSSIRKLELVCRPQFYYNPSPCLPQNYSLDSEDLEQQAQAASTMPVLKELHILVEDDYPGALTARFPSITSAEDLAFNYSIPNVTVTIANHPLGDLVAFYGELMQNKRFTLLSREGQDVAAAHREQQKVQPSPSE